MFVQLSAAHATFQVQLSALPPMVHHVRGDRIQPNMGGGVLTFVVSRGEGVRRLVLEIGERRLQIEEVGYMKEEGFGLASFEIPGIGLDVVGSVAWTLEVVVTGHVWKASDKSGFHLQFGWKPVLTAVMPAVVGIARGGLLSLQGNFVGENLRGVIIGGKEVMAKELLSVTKGEIALRAPRLKNGKGRMKLDILVVDQSGLKSEKKSVLIDSEALGVDAIVLDSSLDAGKERISVPLLCGKKTVPIVAAKVEGGMEGVMEVPVFEFRMRLSNMAAGEVQVVASGKNSMASLEGEGIFGEDEELEEQIVTVWVRATAGRHIGETLLFLSRRLRRDRIGVSVLPFESGFLTQDSRAVLESSMGRLEHCDDVEDLVLSTRWIVNGKLLSSHKSGSSANASDDQGLVIGLGNRVLLPRLTAVTYELAVTVSRRSSGDVFASGLASGVLQASGKKRSLRVAINGGIQFLFAPVETNFTLRCDISDKVDEGEIATLSYFWTCKENASGTCAEYLYPSSLQGRASGVSRFWISPRAGEEGKVVEYSVRVASAIRDSEEVTITVTFVDQEKLLFPHARLETVASFAPAVESGNGFSATFHSYDDIILSIDGEGPASTLDFSLSRTDRQEGDVDMLGQISSRLLIAHNGYWTREAPRGSFLGFRAGELPPGNYTLHGAVGEAAGAGTGATWLFSIAAPPLIVLSEPTTRQGTANWTIFHASAISIPTSDNQFFFSLKLLPDDISTVVADDSHESFATVSRCLGSCSGFGRVSFVVATRGRYVVVVDMYDATGTRFIASKRGQSFISVQDANSSSESAGHTEKAQRGIGAVLRHGDEEAFLETLLKLSPTRSPRPVRLADVMAGLKRISSSPFQNPLQISRVVEACTRVISHEMVEDLDELTGMLKIVESCIRQTPSWAPFGGVIVPGLTRFYGAAGEKLERLWKGLGKEEDGDEKFAKAEHCVDSRAFEDIVIGLSAGVECGGSRRAVVSRKTNVANIGGQDGEEEVMVQDEYQVGVSCLEGQVRQLLPEPALSEVCESGSEEGGSGRHHETRVLAAVERHDVIRRTIAGDIVKGASVHVRLLRWNKKEAGERLIDSEAGVSGKLCVRSRASVARIGGAGRVGLMLNGAGNLKCRKVGRIAISEGGGKKIGDGGEAGRTVSRQDVDELEMDGDGGLGAMATTRVPVRIQLEVNRSVLEICAREQARVMGGGGGIAGVVGWVAGGMIVVMGIVWMGVLVGVRMRARRLREGGRGVDECCRVSSSLGSWGVGGARRLSLSECEWGEGMMQCGGVDEEEEKVGGGRRWRWSGVECFVPDCYGRADYGRV